VILFEGKLYEDSELNNIFEKLWDSCIRTIERRFDISGLVIAACNRLSENIKGGKYDDIIRPMLERGIFTKEQLKSAVAFFEEANLLKKYDAELGVIKNAEGDGKRIESLGVLFHIAAGNAEGLPFFSVIEGMLAGNVNILKLPSMDDGLSVMLLNELVKEEPRLAGYVSVFDVPSTNIASLRFLAGMADAVVVWGSDEAVRAARMMADPETQIISWGHKLSFAYVTPEVFDEPENEELVLLARHICETRQLLCNSCQGIFVDSEDEEVILSAGKKFLGILEKAAADFPPEPVGVRGKLSIAFYNDELEGAGSSKKIFRGKGVSVTVSNDSELELSHMFKNCWVKPLPRKNIVKALKGKRGHLQTVGLICSEAERKELSDILVRTGVTRISHGGDMAVTRPGAAHDGEYPLRRYVRIVDLE